MNPLLKTVVFAAITAAATFAMKRWIEHGSMRTAKEAKPPLHDWENEGGALAPQPFGVETSQVPR